MQVSHESLLHTWDSIWKDKHGKVVIWQTPNVPLIAWAVLTLLCLFTSGKTSDILGGLGDASLVIWSLLEIFKGANYFRRVLGFIVLLFAIASFIKTF